MMAAISGNTQAILLLTAPLLAGRGATPKDLLTAGEYKRLARHLHAMQHKPADLLSTDAEDLLRVCQPIVDELRLRRLLGRGFLLSQAIERWQTRAIWVLSRADPAYPRRLKVRLRDEAPAVLYGCGDIGLLESGGLAVVGSRHVDDTLIDYAMAVGRLAAQAGRTLVSGGAKGIDQAAMRGALESGGKAFGILPDRLEKTAMNRENRNLILDQQLLLISPYDPGAGFNVGHAMQRNKLIYALADASLVVSSDVSKGGTWAGANEQLNKLKIVPVYVRSTGEHSSGLDALRSKGAIPWPNPVNASELASLLAVDLIPIPPASQSPPDMFEQDALQDTKLFVGEKPDGLATTQVSEKSFYPDARKEETTSTHDSDKKQSAARQANPENEIDRYDLSSAQHQSIGSTPGTLVFDAVLASMKLLLESPMKDTEIAAALAITNAQAKAWLQRLVDEGHLSKLSKPVRYVLRKEDLFDQVEDRSGAE